MKEDDLVSQLIKFYSERESEDPATGSLFEWDLEVPYNHYGDRGVVDMIIRETFADGSGGADMLWELKGDSAVSTVTGANEILRQYNRMVKYFFEDESHEPTHPDSLHPIYYRLAFAPTPKCVNHVFQHIQSYKSIDSTEKTKWGDVRKQVAFLTVDAVDEGGVMITQVNVGRFGDYIRRQIESSESFELAIEKSNFEKEEVIGFYE